MSRPWVSSVACLALLAFPALPTGFQSSVRSTIDKRFVGTWRLVSFETPGRADANRGAHPVGLIYYDTGGHMAAQIAPDRPRPSWPPGQTPTSEQAKEAVIGYVAYFGTYVVDDRAATVTHHRDGALNMYAVDLVRKYEFSADGRQLTLVPLENENAGTRLVWERIP